MYSRFVMASSADSREVTHHVLGALNQGMVKRRPVDRLAQVGERLRAFRDAIGLSQAELSSAVNKAANTVAMWETGQRLLDPLAAVTLADRYGASLDWFYRGDLSGVRKDLADRIAGRESERVPDAPDRPFARSSPSLAAPPNRAPRRAGR